MPADVTSLGRSEASPGERNPDAPGAATVAEQERQFRELLEHCPAGLSLVDDDGRLVFHNARLRELLGYEEDELNLFDTRKFWHDLDHRHRIVETLRERGGQLLNEEVIWKTKQGDPVHLLISYVQVAYRAGHVGFVGGKRVAWLYDVTALKQREARLVEQERQFRELLADCPAGLSLVDEEGRLVFHNARLRELLGYEEHELRLFDTRKFWHDLAHRARLIETLRERGGRLINEEVIWRTKRGELVHLARCSCVQVASPDRRRLTITALASSASGDRASRASVRALGRAVGPEAQDAQRAGRGERVGRSAWSSTAIPAKPQVQRRGDGRWIMVSERRTEDGGTVAVYSDITELKQREESLSEKSATLEALSGKLAKYLAPQVYDSIFAGRQDVAIASKRKKLTVFFSDIAGFTETTDKMESEDLTQLLNNYLTEMSKIALQYGATIDKYVGDAIMIFFGDPESRGVKEDALACVKMALAMQKRMGELAGAWRDAGIETPLRCRIGIHTGYCTVGNFGSEDRMDYTIVGGAVNLASRLEHEAPPGGVLISYETFAHVKDEIRCESRGEIRIKGLAYPVATYEAIDFTANLEPAGAAIRTALPHMRLEVDPELMSGEERRQAAAALRQAADRLARQA